jgi:plastocyanin
MNIKLDHFARILAKDFSTTNELFLIMQHKYNFPSSRIITVLVGIVISIIFTTSLDSIPSTIPSSEIKVYGQLGLNPVPTTQEVIATYIARVPPGAALEDSPIHYYPDNIAIPSGITVAWFNDDPGQPHTVTSGVPDSPESGAMFNSGIIPYTSFFQHTFDSQLDNQEIVYHCEIHPWRTAKVSVNGAFEQGHYFVFASGTGQVLNLTEHDRTLLDFRPLTVSTDSTTPITYNITIIDNTSENKTTVFSRSFFAVGNNDLQLELIPRPDQNKTTVYGPDLNDPVTGAYHVEGDFMEPGNEYTIRAEITSIGNDEPPERIVDDFAFRVVS